MGLLAAPAAAQSIGYESVGGGSDGGDTGNQPVYASGSKAKGSGGKSRSKRIEIAPYIEIDQVLDAQLSPNSEVLTYTEAVAGIDASIAGRHNAASASVRYEHRFGWGKAADGDYVSGVAAGHATLAPGVTLQAGGLAAQSSYNGGETRAGSSLVGNSSSRTYSVYGGPSVVSRVGDLDVSASYRAGYTKVDTKSDVTAGSGALSTDLFDESVTQIGNAEAGFAPGTVLPVGVALGGSYYQEDISNLDQRVRDMQARAMVQVPVSRTVQLTGAIGYEDVEVSARDAKRDANGDPIYDSNGRYVTDEASARQLAYDTSGLIWEVGVMWRPSPRTALAAYVGRRYGDISYGGTFSYAPNDRSALHIAVYDRISGYGGQLTRVLDDLPDDFTAVRDPLTGELSTCVNSLSGNGCFGSALSSLRSSVFRARGIAANYTMQLGRINAGIGAGYDRRKYIAAAGTVLASANGVIDENYWVSAFVGGKLGQTAGWSTNLYANWLQTSQAQGGDTASYGATLSYYQMLIRGLRATAAVGIEGSSEEALADDYWNARALLGLRYGF